MQLRKLHETFPLTSIEILGIDIDDVVFYDKWKTDKKFVDVIVARNTIVVGAVMFTFYNRQMVKSFILGDCLIVLMKNNIAYTAPLPNILWFDVFGLPSCFDMCKGDSIAGLVYKNGGHYLTNGGPLVRREWYIPSATQFSKLKMFDDEVFVCTANGQKTIAESPTRRFEIDTPFATIYLIKPIGKLWAAFVCDHRENISQNICQLRWVLIKWHREYFPFVFRQLQVDIIWLHIICWTNPLPRDLIKDMETFFVRITFRDRKVYD